MDRTAWIDAFIAELQKLRPHLAPEWGSSRFALALALNQYDPKQEPKAAALAYHAAQKGRM